jgi:glycosyltransferase involved in cell wall biosynthesis
MGLIEAAAAGAAIVTSCGPGMEHIGELFDDGKEAVLVSNALTDEARVIAYAEAIGMLIRNPDLRRTLAFNAHALASRGRFSLDRHHRQLAEIYDAAFDLTPHRTKTSSGGRSQVLSWSERTCHWTMRTHAPSGALRVRV